MLIVQKYHSIHDIDSEFIVNIETLLQEETPSFTFLCSKHDQAPESDVFTYFLFFSNTQNTPVGFSQVTLRKIPSENYLSLLEKMKFWEDAHKHWKQLSWRIGNGSAGVCVFEPKHAREGKEKMQQLINEYQTRQDVRATEMVCLKGMQDFKCGPLKESFALDSLLKTHKNYQEYMSSLSPEMQKHLKNNWKSIKDRGIDLGDYPSPTRTPKTLPISQAQLERWESWGAQVLTFEKGDQLLGCILVMKGKNGNVFFEPFPFETGDDALVTDELYTQYALIKFFDLSDARRAHLLKGGENLVFDAKADMKFFQDQGFTTRTLTRSFSSELKGLDHPL
jgi:hypothetical protein